jgi:hypothetical protein
MILEFHTSRERRMWWLIPEQKATNLLPVPLKVNLREQVLGQLLGDSWYLKVTSTL